MESWKELAAAMEFEHVIEVHPDGTWSEPVEIWAPEVTLSCTGDGNEQVLPHHEKDMLDALESHGWSLMNGYSQQSGYRGPIMHSSEVIGRDMARGMLESPGFYVAVVIDATPADGENDNDGESVPVGWAVAYREWRESPNGHRKCACCGDLEWHEENQPVCRACMGAGCERTRQVGGGWEWSNCERLDSSDAREASAREIRIAATHPSGQEVRITYEATGQERWQPLVTLRFYDLLPRPYWAVTESSIPGIPVMRKGDIAETWRECLGNVARTLAADSETGALGDALEDWLEAGGN